MFLPRNHHPAGFLFFASNDKTPEQTPKPNKHRSRRWHDFCGGALMGKYGIKNIFISPCAFLIKSYITGNSNREKTMSVQTIFVVTIVVLLALAALQVFVVRKTEK